MSLLKSRVPDKIPGVDRGPLFDEILDDGQPLRIIHAQLASHDGVHEPVDAQRGLPSVQDPLVLGHVLLHLGQFAEEAVVHPLGHLALAARPEVLVENGYRTMKLFSDLQSVGLTGKF